MTHAVGWLHSVSWVEPQGRATTSFGSQVEQAMHAPERFTIGHESAGREIVQPVTIADNDTRMINGESMSHVLCSEMPVLSTAW